MHALLWELGEGLACFRGFPSQDAHWEHRLVLRVRGLGGLCCLSLKIEKLLTLDTVQKRERTECWDYYCELKALEILDYSVTPSCARGSGAVLLLLSDFQVFWSSFCCNFLSLFGSDFCLLLWF